MSRKWLLILLTGLILMPACASSQDSLPDLKKKYPDLIQLTPPENSNGDVLQSKIYIDSVQIITVNNTAALLISGDLPDGCTHIGSAGHEINETKLSITLDAWRDPDMICTQALVSFSFFYSDLPEETLRKYRSADVNGKKYPITEN